LEARAGIEPHQRIENTQLTYYATGEMGAMGGAVAQISTNSHPGSLLRVRRVDPRCDGALDSDNAKARRR
jgi:hypothetical protein